MGSVEPYAAVAETHGAVVFFAGDRAYKLKKPVSFEFFDFSTVERRRRMLARELELNRRLAPDVYLGVVDVLGEPVLVMRRMPDDRRLGDLATRGEDIDACVREVARIVAAFHSGAETSDSIVRRGRVSALRRLWADNFAELDPFAGDPLARSDLAEAAELADAYLDGRVPLFDARCDEGMIRDGHGDLLAADIFCLDDGPRILDCIEFNDEFRWADVLADAAFLAMDLEHLGAPDPAESFLGYYGEFSGEHHPRSLIDFYIAYRAQVRSKVACLRYAQGVPEAGPEAGELLRLCLGHLRAAQVRLVLVGGSPGTGKSTLAAGLSDRLGWTLLHSDEIRKDLAGLGHDMRPEAEFATDLYAPERTKQLYDTLIERAEHLLANGESVIVDASWAKVTYRQVAADTAARTSSLLVELRCELPSELADERLALRRKRGTDVSDAGPAVAARLRASAEAWPDAIAIDTSGTVEDAVESALARIRPRRFGDANGAS